MSVTDYLLRKQKQDITQPVTAQPQEQPQQAAQLPEAARPAVETAKQSIKQGMGDVTPATTETEPATQTEQAQSLTYDDILKSLGTPEETPEDKEREARNKAIAGVGDAISSIANLVAVNKGAANAFTPTLSNAYKQYYDKIKAERDANRQAAMNYYFKNMDLEAAQAAAARDQANKDREFKFKENEAARQADKDAKELAIKQDNAKKQQAYIDAKIDALGKDGARKDKIASATIRKYNAQALIAASGGEPVVMYINGEKVNVPKNAWNEANINKIFDMLPLTEEESRGAKSLEQTFGDNKFSASYKPYTIKQKAELIGKYMEKDPDVARAVKEIAGIKTKTDFSQYQDDEDTNDDDFEQYLMEE